MAGPYHQGVHEGTCLGDPWGLLVPLVGRGQGAHVGQGHSWDQMVAFPQSVVVGGPVDLVPSWGLAFLEVVVPSCQGVEGL